jgi:CubicO group peptidase (beta-lactamase class C family)
VNELEAAFHRQHTRGVFPGAQLVVLRGGKPLADLSVGLASGFRAGEPQVAVSPSTRFQVFSASKPFVAMAVAMLEERGLLRVDDPLGHFVPGWPTDRTVLDVLTHRSGIVLPQVVADERRWRDPEGIRDAIASTAPRYARGVLAYAPYEFGWILGEVVARAAGAPLPTFLDRELFQRAGLSASFTTTEPIARSYWLGGPRVVAGVELSARWEEVQNDPATLATVCPGAQLIANAQALARFYELLLDGGRGILKPETLETYTRVHASGLDRSNRLPLRVGRGLLLGQLMPSLYGFVGTSHCFGHAGAFCTVAGADPKTGIAFAYVTNANRGPYDLLWRSAGLWSRARGVA